MAEQIVPRLQLRHPLSKHHDGLVKLYQHPLVNAHIGGQQLLSRAAELADRIIREAADGKAFYGLYTDRESGEVVGLTSLHMRPQHQVEVGVLINPDYQQQGVCRWALIGSMRQAERFFKQPVASFICYVDEHNVSANITAERLGFVQVADNNTSAGRPGQNYYEFDKEQLSNER